MSFWRIRNFAFPRCSICKAFCGKTFACVVQHEKYLLVSPREIWWERSNWWECGMQMQVKVKPGTYEFESALEDWMRRVREEHDTEGRLYYLLQQLYPSSHYQLQVRAMNDVGWSEPNPMFIFSTATGGLCYIDTWLVNVIAIIMNLWGFLSWRSCCSAYADNEFLFLFINICELRHCKSR